MKRRHLSWKKKLAFSAAVLTAGLTALEGSVRLYNKVRHGRWTAVDPEGAAANSRLYVRHQWLGQMLRPNTHVVAKGRRIGINSFGFRGPECSPEKATDTLRIACIGGSTTFDVKVSEDAKAWPAQMERLLNERFSGDGRREPPSLRRIEVINAATNGYALPRTIIDLALRTLDFRPDWIVCYPGVNDVAYAHRASHQFGMAYAAVVSEDASSLLSRLLPHSELYNEITHRIRYACQSRYGNWDGRPIERRDTPDARGLVAFERNLTTLAGICRAHGIRLALVTVRTAYDRNQPLTEQMRLAESDLMDHPCLTLDGHYAGYAGASRLIRQAAERFGLPLIDQDVDLPSEEAHFADSVHFNDAGAAAFAAYAAQILAPLLADPLVDPHAGDRDSTRATAQRDP